MYDVGLFTVDEYITIAKEKHGYNTEQVGECSLCACVCGEGGRGGVYGMEDGAHISFINFVRFCKKGLHV